MTFYKQWRNTARNVKISTWTNFGLQNSMVGIFFGNYKKLINTLEWLDDKNIMRKVGKALVNAISQF